MAIYKSAREEQIDNQTAGRAREEALQVRAEVPSVRREDRVRIAKRTGASGGTRKHPPKGRNTGNGIHG